MTTVTAINDMGVKGEAIFKGLNRVVYRVPDMDHGKQWSKKVLDREPSFGKLELDSAFHRHGAHNFYEKMGFENRAYLFSMGSPDAASDAMRSSSVRDQS
jgi:hypothetical protein